MHACKHFLLDNLSCWDYRVVMKCPIHNIPLVCYCPACLGSATSERKAEASRENGMLGGRPVGSKDSKPRNSKKKTRRAVSEASSRR